MQKQLDDDIAAIHKCIKTMKKSARLGLLELDGEKKKKKCPSDKQVKKCEIKIKKLKPKQKACKALEGIGKKDVDSILKLIKQWNRQKVLKKDCKLDKGETKYHYVDRLSNHFRTKLKKIREAACRLEQKARQREKAEKRLRPHQKLSEETQGQSLCHHQSKQLCMQVRQSHQGKKKCARCLMAAIVRLSEQPRTTGRRLKRRMP